MTWIDRGILTFYVLLGLKATSEAIDRYLIGLWA